MSKTLQIRSLTLGSDRPGIITPIAARTAEGILACARKATAHPHVDLAEWRADFWEHASDIQETLSMLASLRNILQDKPLLYTFRTPREGGQTPVSDEAYLQLCQCAAASRNADLIDVEISSPKAAECIRFLHAHGIPAVGSWHDFEQTPPEETLTARLRCLQAAGADLLKIAVMSRSENDVNTLMRAAQAFSLSEAQSPMIAIAMGEPGTESRIRPEKFASCLTFAALDTASAPGQISVDALYAQR